MTRVGYAKLAHDVAGANDARRAESRERLRRQGFVFVEDGAFRTVTAAPGAFRRCSESANSAERTMRLRVFESPYVTEARASMSTPEAVYVDANFEHACAFLQGREQGLDVWAVGAAEGGRLERVAGPRLLARGPDGGSFAIVETPRVTGRRTVKVDHCDDGAKAGNAPPFVAVVWAPKPDALPTIGLTYDEEVVAMECPSQGTIMIFR